MLMALKSSLKHRRKHVLRLTTIWRAGLKSVPWTLAEFYFNKRSAETVYWQLHNPAKKNIQLVSLSACCFLESKIDQLNFEGRD